MGVPAFSPDYQHQNDYNNQSEYTNNNDDFGMICKEEKNRKRFELNEVFQRGKKPQGFFEITTKQ